MRRMQFAPLAFVLLACGVASADERTETIRFLTTLQKPDGGFTSDGAPGAPSSLRATSAAVRALKYLGGEVPNVDRVTAFVKDCFDPTTGAFADRPTGKADVIVTCVGMMACAELLKEFDYAPSVKYLVANAKTFEERRLAVAGMEAAKSFAPELDAWFAEIEKSRNADGTFGKGDSLGRDTGGTVAMLLRSGRKFDDERRATVVKTLKASQRPDGGFGKADAKGSDLETTYRVMRALHLLAEKPSDVEKLRSFLEAHRNADGGYTVEPGKGSSASATYYVAAVQKWLARK